MKERDEFKETDKSSFYIEVELAPLASPEVLSETASLCSRYSTYSGEHKFMQANLGLEENIVCEFDNMQSDSDNLGQGSPQLSVKTISSEYSKQVSFKTFDMYKVQNDTNKACSRKSPILKPSHLKRPRSENQFLVLSADNCLQSDL